MENQYPIEKYQNFKVNNFKKIMSHLNNCENGESFIGELERSEKVFDYVGDSNFILIKCVTHFKKYLSNYWYYYY